MQTHETAKILYKLIGITRLMKRVKLSIYAAKRSDLRSDIKLAFRFWRGGR
jgi:hypothetical protein